MPRATHLISPAAFVASRIGPDLTEHFLVRLLQKIGHPEPTSATDLASGPAPMPLPFPVRQAW